MSYEEGEPVAAPASPVRDDPPDELSDADEDVDEDGVPDGAERAPKKRAVRPRSAVARFAGYAADRDFAGHGLVIRDNRLFCGTCEVFLSAKTRALVKQHIWGVQCPDEARKAAMAAGTFKEHTGHMTIIVQRARVSTRSGGQTSIKDHLRPVGTVPPASLNRREDVAEAFMCAGVSFNALESPLLRAVLESAPAPLGGRQGVSKTITSVTKRTFERYRGELRDKEVAVMYDGGEVNYKLQATLVRYIGDDMRIVTLAIGAKRVGSNVKGQDVADILRDHLSRVGVSLDDVKVAVADRCKVNLKAHKVLLGSDNVRDAARRFDLFGCLCHTLDNAGDAMEEKLTLVTRFMSLWKKMRKSTLLVENFREAFDGAPYPTYTAVRWWSLQEAVAQIEPIFQRIPAFLRAQKKTTCQATIASILEMLSAGQSRDRFNLEIQLFIVKSTAKVLVDASVSLQCHGFIAPFVADIIASVDSACTLWSGAHGRQEIANKISTRLNAFGRTDDARPAGAPMAFPWVNDGVFVDEVSLARCVGRA
jgi:hypothetical protein